MDSIVLSQRLDDLKLKLEQSATERHIVNGKMHGALHSIFEKTEILSEKTDRQDTILGQLSDSVKQITETVKRIELRLIGDESLQSTGVIQEQADQKVKLATHEARIDKVEETVKVHKTAYESDKRALGWIAVVLVAIGGIVSWLQTTGAGQFLTKGK